MPRPGKRSSKLQLSLGLDVKPIQKTKILEKGTIYKDKINKDDTQNLMKLDNMFHDKNKLADAVYIGKKLLKSYGPTIFALTKLEDMKLYAIGLNKNQIDHINKIRK